MARGELPGLDEDGVTLPVVPVSIPDSLLQGRVPGVPCPDSNTAEPVPCSSGQCLLPHIMSPACAASLMSNVWMNVSTLRACA